MCFRGGIYIKKGKKRLDFISIINYSLDGWSELRCSWADLSKHQDWRVLVLVSSKTVLFGIKENEKESGRRLKIVLEKS